MRERARDATGSIAVELMGILPLLLLAALAAWQILLAGFVATSAQNAARTASRVEGLGGDGERAGLESLSPWLRDGATADLEDTRATVTILVPVIVPGFTTDAFRITRTAELPS